MLPSQNRRSSFSSSTTSSQAKRHLPAASENVAKANAVAPHLAKKRAPLSNITNQKNVHVASKTSAPSTLVPCASKVNKTKKVSSVSTGNSAVTEKVIPQFLNPKSIAVVSSCDDASNQIKDESSCRASSISASCSMDESPSRSDANSVSGDETMSTCDSFKSPEVEYLDNSDVPAMDSIDRKTFGSLCISDHSETQGSICKRDCFMKIEKDDVLANIDSDYMDTQLCASIACDIYQHLRASEAKKRPSIDFMEKVQKDITANMRAILIDWLVEVAEEYRLVPDTLYLTVNYIDRYLSGNVMNRQRLQLLGVACMMIAAKYEEICAPQVEEFCYITDNTYFKEEVLEMESAVLNYLKFEMTAPTVKCFLRRFVRAAQGMDEAPSMQLECMANYIAELSLLEYSMLRYAPSLLAASSIFLAKYILNPSQKPWNSTLKHYTLYEPSDLRDCVKDLHRLCSESQNSGLSAIRDKYSLHKYKCVARKNCLSSIPPEYFDNQS